MTAKEMLDFVEKAYNEGNMPIWDYEKFKEEFRGKTAKEMFEELGYDYFNNGVRITCQNYKISKCKLIEFQLWNKKMWLSDDSEEVVELSLGEIKAINKQVEELWGDEI